MFLNACTTQGRGQGLLPTPDVTSSPAFGKLRDVLSSPALTSFPKASWCPVITNLFLKVSQTFPNARSFPNKNHSYSLSQTFKRGRTFPKVSKSLWKCEPFLFAFLILSKTWHSFCSPYLAQYLHNAKSVPFLKSYKKFIYHYLIIYLVHFPFTCSVYLLKFASLNKKHIGERAWLITRH